MLNDIGGKEQFHPFAAVVCLKKIKLRRKRVKNKRYAKMRINYLNGNHIFPCIEARFCLYRAFGCYKKKNIFVL